MKTHERHKNRYEQNRMPPGQAGQPQQHEESVQEFIAYLYSVIRDDPAVVRVIDRALKQRYGHLPEQDNVDKRC